MTTLITRAAILDKYGLRLSMDQLAEALGLQTTTIYNQISLGQFPVRTYREGARRFASYEAVAEYLDAMDEAAKAKLNAE